MIQELQLKLSPYEASSIDIIKKVISKQIHIPIEDITHIQVVKKIYQKEVLLQRTNVNHI